MDRTKPTCRRSLASHDSGLGLLYIALRILRSELLFELSVRKPSEKGRSGGSRLHDVPEPGNLRQIEAVPTI